MYPRLKQLLRRSRLLANLYTHWKRRAALARFELKDICDSYLTSATKPQMTPYGFQICGSQSMHHIAMQRGEFEPEETELFIQQYEQADVVVDVGANIGFYTCLARSYGKHVLAVEPLPRNLKYLMSNLVVNKWSDVEVFPVGLSAKPGLATLYGASSTGASLIGSWAGASRVFQRTIPLTTLDILIGNRFEGRRLFIKIDVEGAEYSVLCGAVATLQLNPKPSWVLEICLDEYHPHGMNPDFKSTFELFWKHGYEIRAANKSKKLIKPSDVARWVGSGKCDSGTINYIMTPL